MKNKIINVFYHNLLVGRLAETPQKLCAFEYSPGWLADGFSISPFKLPLQKKVFIAEREPFSGNFGVFDDSLPDGWGRLLVDRLLIKKHINPAEVSLLDRLAIVGSSGMGALEYQPVEKFVPNVKVGNIKELAVEAEAILNENYSGNLEELVKVAGSSGGARPKVLIKIDGDDWLIKFRSSLDYKDIGKLEFKYSEAARTAGLEMPETRLFEGKFFGVKRFDRKSNGKKVFMISASGLLHASHRVPTLDYSDLMMLTLKLTRDYNEVAKMFRLMCFNVFAYNRDDHSKNFSFLYDADRWQLAPAYDLVYSEGLGGEHATMIAGEGKNPSEKDILNVAGKANLDRRTAENIMEEVLAAVKKAKIVNFERSTRFNYQNY